jgi:hypothetical protein
VSGAAGRLERALVASAARAGTTIRVDAHDAQSWRSATFAGGRHRLEASAASGVRLDAWLAALGADAIAVPGHVVADLSVGACVRVGETTHFSLEGVTVERE